MSRISVALRSVAAAALLSSAANADVPTVATDIAPVHSLVSRVMDGVGTPSLVIAQGASPHEYSLRPSEARALQDADIVFWIGEDLTPWLEHSIETLAEDATVIGLLASEGTARLEFREGALFEAHGHGSEDGHDEDHHDDHEEHAEHHDEHKDHGDDHDEHGEDHDDHGHEEHAHDEHGHEHGEHDPHAWLSAQNASVWLNTIAAALSAADPGNAGKYYANAAAGREELAALAQEIKSQLAHVKGRKFIVFHDAYQYFETDFDIPADGAIAFSDASDPSPARIAEVRARVVDEDIACVLSEPQFNQSLVKTVTEGTPAKTAQIDPLGSEIEAGPAFYPQLLRNLASALADCL